MNDVSGRLCLSMRHCQHHPGVQLLQGGHQCSTSSRPLSAPAVLQGVCSEAASFDLPAPVLSACIKEVDRAYRAAMLRLESQSAQMGATSTGARTLTGCCREEHTPCTLGC